ncbi:MAG: aminotransferase class III-fold pyridoxal phosphate-dependent enzyme [Gammaproteobacteria bacterium]
MNDSWLSWSFPGHVSDLGSVAALCAALVVLVMLVTRYRYLVYALRAQSFAPVVSRVLSHFLRTRDSDVETLVRADGAPEGFAAQRRAALAALRARLAARTAESSRWADEVRDGLSDLRFTDASRVPFPFARIMREGFNVASVVDASRGSRLRDLDGNWNIDVGGSYGVNVAGYDRYKEWMQRGAERARDLGPVLGPLHPVVADNIARLQRISGLDEVSFHASGTEAVMAAVRLARFNTRRKLIVTFAGAYHGWWDGVQPGLGSERGIDDCLTLKDMHEASLDLIRTRAHDIAGVLVNPVQSFHPNSPPPNDAVLLNNQLRRTETDTHPYARWLARLRAVCSAAGVPLIFDEVFSGFRLAPGGAQEYFGTPADIVVYGKTLGGGMPVGVVCGRRELMRRFDPDHPMRMAYVVGTFAAHPVVMTTMNEFLHWLEEAPTAECYARANAHANRWRDESNEAFRRAGLPLEVTNLGTIWTLQFTQPGRYHWLMQYYLRAEGINLSWVGTGRCMFNFDFSADDYRELREKILAAGAAMRRDKWWLSEEEHAGRDRAIRRGVTRDVLAGLFAPPRPLQAFHAEVMRRKHDDHVASHSNPVNQLLHLLSSSVFIVCYGLVFSDLATAMWLGLSALFVRQVGHALIEPPCHDKEQLLLGFDTRSKTRVVGIYLLIPLLNAWFAPSFTGTALVELAETIALQWLVFTGIVIGGHVVRLTRRHGFRNAMVWFVKLVTDPLTDLQAYTPTLLGARR